MLKQHHINSRVHVRINRIIQSGLLGQVENGPRAIIRNREIAWSKALPPEEYLGQTREAVVIGFNPAYKELELSLRLVERDPWQEASRKYAPGSEVQGQIVGLIEGAAFVELEPGVEGFLPAGELPLEPTERIENWLWIHDHVKALVTELDPPHRRLRLSLRGLLIQREALFRRRLWATRKRAPSSGTTIAEMLPKDTRLELLRMVADREALTLEPRLQALVIEDDEIYAAGLETFLQCNGCQVTLARDGMAGLAHVRTRDNPFDLVLIDWNLPGPKGHELVNQLQQEGCPSRLAMVLEPTPLRERSEIWESLWGSGIDVFSKAEGQECKIGLVSIVRELRSNAFSPEELQRRYFPETTPPPLKQPPPLSADGGRLPLTEQQEGIQAILTRLQHDAQATTVMLLRMEPGQSRFELEGCAGDPFPLEQAPPDLVYSPLSDVLQKGQEVYEKVAHQSLAFKRLLDLIRFQGFLGIPLPTVESARYGLFLLKEQGKFDWRQCRDARLAAHLIAGVLQERRLIKALQPWQAQNLVGQLANSIIHEITNKLGGLEYQVEALQRGLRRLACWPEKAEDATFLRRLDQAVEGIAGVQQQTDRLRDQYLGLTASDEAQLVSLRALAEDMIRILRPEAKVHNILLASESPDDLPRVRARPSQLQQIFLNLMLNAIQQMAAIERQGSLTIEICYVPDASRPLQVRFIDDGPGIHTQLWERIFDFGFTTKKGGAGLGLTISRQAAASLGGELRVEKSYVLWGTTFLLELPEGA